MPPVWREVRPEWGREAGSGSVEPSGERVGRAVHETFGWQGRSRLTPASAGGKG